MRIIGLKRLMSRLMPKADHHKYGEPKDQRLNGLLTVTGKKGLTKLAKNHRISVSELLEKIGRGELIVSEPEPETERGKAIANS